MFVWYSSEVQRPTLFVFTQEKMASTSGGGGGGRLNIGASIEKLMELAHSTGELVLTCRNLKSFPKNRCKYDLKDTVLVGKKFQLLWRAGTDSSLVLV